MNEHCGRNVTMQAVAILLLAVSSAVAQTAPPSNAPLYLDPSQPADVRVQDLVSRMTLEEKASQLVALGVALGAPTLRSQTGDDSRRTFPRAPQKSARPGRRPGA